MKKAIAKIPAPVLKKFGAAQSITECIGPTIFDCLDLFSRNVLGHSPSYIQFLDVLK